MKANRIIVGIYIFIGIGFGESYAGINTNNLFTGFSTLEAQLTQKFFIDFSRTDDVKYLQKASWYYLPNSCSITNSIDKKERLSRLKRTVEFLNFCYSQRDHNYDPYNPPKFKTKISIPQKRIPAILIDLDMDAQADSTGFLNTKEVIAENERRKKKYTREKELLHLVEKGIMEIKKYRDSVTDETNTKEYTAILGIIETETSDPLIKKRLLEEPFQSELEQITTIYWEYYHQTGNMQYLTRFCNEIYIDLRNKSFQKKSALNELRLLLDAMMESHKQKQLIEQQSERSFSNPAEERLYKKKLSTIEKPIQLGVKCIPEYLEQIKINNPKEYQKAVEMIQQIVQDKKFASRLIK